MPPALLSFSRASSVLHWRENGRLPRVPDRVSAALAICQSEKSLPVLCGKILLVEDPARSVDRCMRTLVERSGFASRPIRSGHRQP